MNRNRGLRRTGPPPRRQPLTASTRPHRRTPLRSYGNKSRPSLPAARRAVRERSGGRCEAGTPVCTGTATHGPHHALLRAHTKRDDPALMLDVCNPCHLWIHAHPAASYEAGWLVHPWHQPTTTPPEAA